MQRTPTAKTSIIPLYHGPYRIRLPAPAGDLLYHKVVKRWVAKPCAICHRVATFFHNNELWSFEVMVGRSQSGPEYKVTECGHVFHKACLHSYLTRPSERIALACEKCKDIKTYVHEQDWDALDVEVAMNVFAK
jgi:hypothetical protein